MEELMRDALILAIKHDFDVYNALDIFQNGTVLKELKFGIGDGRLQYYIYNWRTAEVAAPEVGLVLL
jgi:glycylpeptide N-tetradecanoyltransferase